MPQDQRSVKEPLTAIKDESAAVRYFAIGLLDPSKSKDHERALVASLDDDVRWLRYTAAVKLAQAESHVDEVSPVLVEALGGDESTFHLWGTRHVFQSIHKIGAPALPHLAIALDTPNEQLRENVCHVLGQMPGIVKDREHYQKPLSGARRCS